MSKGLVRKIEYLASCRGNFSTTRHLGKSETMLPLFLKEGGVLAAGAVMNINY